MTTKLDTTQRDVRVEVGTAKVHWLQNERRTFRDLNRRVRVHVWTDEPFNVLEDLQNRNRRPHQAWLAPVQSILAELGFTGIKLRWSQYAGCSCPCSPGFIMVDGAVQHGLRGGDLFITLAGAPSVDENLPARQI